MSSPTIVCREIFHNIINFSEYMTGKDLKNVQTCVPGPMKHVLACFSSFPTINRPIYYQFSKLQNVSQNMPVSIYGGKRAETLPFRPCNGRICKSHVFFHHFLSNNYFYKLKDFFSRNRTEEELRHA